MTVVNNQTFGFRDVKGQTARVTMFVTAATEAAALTAATNISTALVALTNAALNTAKGAYNLPPATNAYGAAAQYQNIEDKLVLTFQTSTGALHRYQIPAPKVTMFQPDEETVKIPDAGGDAQQILLDAFVSAMLAGGCSRDGAALDSFIGGIYLRRRFQRKFNIYTRDPGLSGPGE